MRYFKLTDGRLDEYFGPQMGAAWYAAEGYLPYAGTLGTDWLYINADGAIAERSSEDYAALHPPPPKRYSRLKIISKLGADWIAIESGMSALERAKFYGATFLERGNADFEAFIEKLKPSMPSIEDLLIGCEYE